MDHPEQDPRHRAEQLHLLQGLLRVLDDPHGFLEAMLSATDEAAARQALHDRFGLDESQAQMALNMQFWSLTGQRRQLFRDEADMLRG
jgi:DNA gyrase subunit A